MKQVQTMVVGHRWRKVCIEVNMQPSDYYVSEKRPSPDAANTSKLMAIILNRLLKRNSSWGRSQA